MITLVVRPDGTLAVASERITAADALRWVAAKHHVFCVEVRDGEWALVELGTQLTLQQADAARPTLLPLPPVKALDETDDDSQGGGPL